MLEWWSAPHRVNCQTVATVSSLAAALLFALHLPSCRRRHCLSFDLLQFWAASFINLQYNHVKSMLVLPMQTCYQKMCLCVGSGFAKGLNWFPSTWSPFYEWYCTHSHNIYICSIICTCCSIMCCPVWCGGLSVGYQFLLASLFQTRRNGVTWKCWLLEEAL